MASKVNTRFVVLLSTVLVLVFGGVSGAAYYVLVLKSQAHYEKLGDRKRAEGDLGAAQELYARSFAKDRSHVGVLTKWRDTLREWIPPTESLYTERYGMLTQVLAMRARLLVTDVDAHREHLDARYEQTLQGEQSRARWDDLIIATEEVLANFSSSQDPNWPMLRRYRGLARIAIMSMGSEQTDEQLAQAREDLVEALRVNPTDERSVAGLVQWYLNTAEHADRRGDHATAREARANAHGVINDFIARAPDNPGGVLTQFQIDLAGAMNSIPGNLTAQQAVTARREATAPLVPKLRETHAKMLAGDRSRLSAGLIQRFMSCAAIAPGTEGLELTLALVRGARELKPQNGDLLYLEALMLDELGRTDEALAAYRALEELPPLPLSLDGLLLTYRKHDAMNNQAKLHIKRAEAAPDAAARQAALDEARKVRERLAQVVAEDSVQLAIIDAKIAVVNLDWTTAQRLLRDVNARTGNRLPEALWLMGLASMKLSQPGVAEEYYQRLYELQPEQLAAVVALAEVKQGLQKLNEAYELYGSAVALDPNAPELQARRDMVGAMLGLGSTITDPVNRAMAEFRRLYFGTDTDLGDPQRAEMYLLSKLDEPALNYNPSLVSMLARLLVGGKKLDQARYVVDESLKRHPDDAGLQRLKNALAAGDTLAMEVEWIRQDSLPEEVKLVSIYNAYVNHGKREEGVQFLQEAARIAPENVNVVEYQFIEALLAKDFGECARLVDLAARKNMDGANGLTYRARVQRAQGDTRGAITTMEQAVALGTASARAWRLLGAWQLEAGQVSAGVESFAKALALNTSDIESIRAYVQALLQAGRAGEALGAARTHRRAAQSNEQFVDLWLFLEAAYGDKAMALQQREEILKRNPGNVLNKTALAGLYLDQRDWAKSRQLIDELRKTGDSLGLVQLDATWHADRNDLEQARRVFMDYITRQDRSKLDSVPYITMGHFMIERGALDVGLAALDQARRYQRPESMEGDLALGDANFRLGRYEQAVEAYERIRAAGLPDPSFALASRIAESLGRLGRYEESERVLSELGPKADEDLKVVLLRADAARGRGNRAAATDLLNRAIAMAPRDPLPYLKRAEFLVNEQEQYNDALADLDQALRIAPQFWEALRARSAVYFALNRTDEALRDLRAALDANPNQDDLRVGLMVELLERDRVVEALEIAQGGINLRPGDIERKMAYGDLFFRQGKHAQAAQLYAAAWQQTEAQRPSPEIAQRLLDAILRAERPDVQAAERVLERLGAQVVQQSPGLLMARASLRLRQNDQGKAYEDLNAAFGLINPQSPQMPTWFAGVRRVLQTPKATDDYLAQLERAVSSDWIPYFRASMLIEDPATRTQGLDTVSQLLTRTANPTLRLTILKQRSMDRYRAGEYEAAAQDMRQVLEVNPNDPEATNNLAYTLARHLNRAEEAVGVAEKAYEVSGNNPNVLDTLGVVYLLAGRTQEALGALTQALRRAGNPADKATISVHLAEAKLAAGDRAGAMRLLDLVDIQFREDPALKERLQAEYDQVFEKIRSTR